MSLYQVGSADPALVYAGDWFIGDMSSDSNATTHGTRAVGSNVTFVFDGMGRFHMHTLNFLLTPCRRSLCRSVRHSRQHRCRPHVDHRRRNTGTRRAAGTVTTSIPLPILQHTTQRHEAHARHHERIGRVDALAGLPHVRQYKRRYPICEIGPCEDNVRGQHARSEEHAAGDNCAGGSRKCTCLSCRHCVDRAACAEAAQAKAGPAA